MRWITSFAAVCGLVCVLSLQAQEPVKPGPEHEKLKASVGTWDAVAVSNGKESKGVMKARMALGNLWLIEEFEGEMEGMKFEGHGTTTFDPQKKKYVNIWIDSMSTAPMLLEGTFEKDNRLVLKGKMPMPDGSNMNCTITNVYKDANTILLTLDAAGPDGKAMEMIKITYTRRKK